MEFHISTKRKKELISPELDNRFKDESLCKVAELKNGVAQLKKDILEKASDLLKKEMGIDINHLTNKEKTIIINALKTKYKLSE